MVEFMSFPPTIVIRHTKENPKKCSILPLKGRADVVFFNHPLTGALPDLTNHVRLAAEGPALSADDREHGILLLDGSWRSAGSMTRDFLHVPPRSLAGFVTAYPRVSKLGTDPDNGLASIEALYIAYRLLGRDTAGLLDHYRWAAEFLAANRLTPTAPEA
jgi:rRNA small subunit aminocarboxypropyltransferase